MSIPAFSEPHYGITTTLSALSFDAAIARVTSALRTEGFGVLTEIDVTETMKKKLDVEVPRYTILGACNPELALKALSAEPGIGLLLPCNFVVAEQANGDIVVSAANPSALFEIVSREDIAMVADEVRQRVARVISSL